MPGDALVRRPVTRRQAAVAAGALALSAALLVLLDRGDGIWRALYPDLPRPIQALPYRLRSVWPADPRTPVPLPMPASDSLVGASRAPSAPPASAPPAPAPDESAPGPDGTEASPAPSQVGAASVPVPATTARSARPANRPSAPPGAAAPLASATPPLSTPPTAFPLAPPTLFSPTQAAPPAAALPTGPHQYQTWNNCGPATVAMAVSVLGDIVDQAEAARSLKPDPDDKNVSPEEMAGFAVARGHGATVRMDGTVDRLRVLLAAGLPVIVETWFVPEPGDEMGHYRLLTGYEDRDGAFVAQDSYHGPGVRLPYAEFDTAWRVFNRVYVVVHPTNRAGDVSSILAEDADTRAMYLGALARAEAELADGEDAFGWFNLGTDLLGLGDAEGAAGAYDRARALGLPWRMLWYQFGPFHAYGAVGRWDDVDALASANLRNAANLEESHYWLGRARLGRGDNAGALAAWRRALELNPGFAPAREALSGP